MTGLSQEARALIEGVSELDGPSPTDKVRIQQRLALQLGAAAFTASVLPLASAGAGGALGAGSGAAAQAASAAGTGFGTLTSKSLWLGGLGKALLGVAALGGLGVALWAGVPDPQLAAPQRATPRLASSLARGPARFDAPVQPAPAPATPPSAAPELAPAVPAAPEALPTEVRTSSAPRSTGRVKAAPPPPADTLGAELALLGRAHAALRAGRFQEALTLSEEHRSRFPAGVMQEERLGVVALAECGLSPTRQAAAQAFLRQAAGSPLAARVRKACELP
jgi:hypothetical protein